MTQTVPEVGLKTEPYREQFGQQMGVWNGSEFAVRGDSKSWYPKTWMEYLRGFWKYGFAVERTRRRVDDVLKKFQWFASYSTVLNMTESVDRAELTVEANTSASAYLSKALGEHHPFIVDVIAPNIPAKLAADLDEVTALAALLALAPGDTLTVSDGISRLIQRLTLLSEAKVVTDTHVDRLIQGLDGKWMLEYAPNQDEYGLCSSRVFDFVILAPPAQESGIELSPNLEGFGSLTKEEGSQRHITYFTSEKRMSPLAFNQSYGETLPEDILTSKSGAGEAGIYSITIQYQVVPADVGDAIPYFEFSLPRSLQT